MIEAQDLNYEKSVLIGVITKAQPEEKMKEYLDELEFLTYTAGGEVLKRFVQRIDVPNPKTYIGTGKMLEVAEFVKEHEIGAVIFDDELSPGQQKNIERELKCKIVDRTSLILRYFCPKGPNLLCQNTSRVGPIPIFITQTSGSLDPLRTSKRGYWNAWTWRDRD